MPSRMSEPDDDPLWQALDAYHVGSPDAVQTFADRLARENGWSAAYTARVITECKRFCWLAVRSGHPVTPSEEVDQAWHLHMLHSREYWESFCPKVLGRPLHHGPTRGGLTERDKHFEHYAMTLRSYEARFGPIPADIWPDGATRFRREPLARRVHRDRYLIVEGKRAMLAIGIAVACAPAGMIWIAGLIG